MNRWLNGSTAPDVYQFQSIANYFGMPYEWFLGGGVGFLSYPGNAAAVYRFDVGMAADRSEPLERVRLSGGSPMESGFDLIATGPIKGGVDALAILDEYRANGFVKPGDIVAFKQAGPHTSISKPTRITAIIPVRTAAPPTTTPCMVKRPCGSWLVGGWRWRQTAPRAAVLRQARS